MRHGFTVVTLLVCAAPTLGIVVAHPSQYIARPDNALVGKLGGGSCVPIGARYAVTAAHVGVSSKAQVSVNGVFYPVKRTFSHPSGSGVDMKVIEINGLFQEWVTLHPAPRTVPIGSQVYIGGTGYETAAGPSGDCIAWGARAEHWATNAISGYFDSTVGYAWYRFNANLPNEGIATAFDSGSPLMVMDPDDCRMYLMGIATSASTATGPTCDGHAAYYLLTDDPWLDQFTGPACTGDVDRDGLTGLSDFIVLVHAMNGTEMDCAARFRGDLNGDGLINIADFIVLSNDFGCVP